MPLGGGQRDWHCRPLRVDSGVNSLFYMGLVLGGKCIQMVSPTVSLKGVLWVCVEGEDG